MFERFLERLIERIVGKFFEKAVKPLSPENEKLEDDGTPKVAYVAMKGIIDTEDETSDKRSKSSIISLHRYEKVLEEAFASPTKAIFLEIESPGGSAIESALIAEKIKELAEQYNKEVHVFIPRMAASAGLELACTGHKIHAHPQAYIGSVGAQMMYQIGYHRLLDRFGLENRIITSSGSDLKGAGNPAAPFTEEQRRAEQEIVDDSLHYLKNFIIKNRGEKLDLTNPYIQKIFRGGCTLAFHALDGGLIDTHRKKEDVLRDYGEDAKLAVFKPTSKSPSLIDKLGLGISCLAEETAVGAVRGGISALEKESTGIPQKTISVNY